MADKSVEDKSVDYLHPEGGKPKTPPRNAEEKENVEDAKESTELAKKLKQPAEAQVNSEN